MGAALKEIHTPDLRDLRAWWPAPEAPAILVQLMVGPEGGRGMESFDVMLCTADWLASRAQDEGIVDGRHCFVVGERDDYRPERIEQYFRRRVSACEGPTWKEVAAKVGRLGQWEFEDYVERTP